MRSFSIIIFRVSLIIICVLSGFSCLSEEYYVIARSGLVVRDQPSIKGKRINKIPYRTQVTIKKRTQYHYTVSENGYQIHGDWVEIENDSVSDSKSYVFDGYLAESEVISSSFDVFSDLYRDEFKHIFNVYPLNNNLYGIIIPISDSDLNLNPYITDLGNDYELQEKDLRKTGLFKNTLLDLYENGQVTEKYNHLMGDRYYIYGTKKKYQTTVKEVLFHYDMPGCQGPFIILIIETPNKVLIGDAVLASKESLAISYGHYLYQSSYYNYNMNMISMWSDCAFWGDSGHIKVFGKYKNFYLGYRNKDELYRTFFSIEKDGLYIYYLDSMDLFGCGCL